MTKNVEWYIRLLNHTLVSEQTSTNFVDLFRINSDLVG